MERGGTYIPASRFPRKHAPNVLSNWTEWRAGVVRFTGDEVMRWENAIWGKVKIGQGYVSRGIVGGMRGRLFKGGYPEGK